MASKQVAGPVKNAERARATEATFGKDSAADPWRDSPALAGLNQCLSPSKDVRGQGTSAPGDVPWNREWLSAAYGDRFGTDGGPKEEQPGYGQRAERTQAEEAKLKGATAEGYRVTVSQVVQ